MTADLTHTNLSALALTIIVTTLSTCGLGLLMGCLSLLTANVMFVNNTVYFLLLIFSGANVELSQLALMDAGYLQRAAAHTRNRLRAGIDRRRKPAGRSATPGTGTWDRFDLRFAGIFPVQMGREFRQATRHAGNDINEKGDLIRVVFLQKQMNRR